jgi:hypothetical protein
MNRQLAALRVGVEDIRQYLDQEQQGKLLGNLNYLGDAARTAPAAVAPNEWLIVNDQLEHIERESRQVFELYRQRLCDLVAEIERHGFVRPKRLIGLRKRFLEEISAAIEKLGTTARVQQMALLTRIVAVEQRCSLGADIEITENHCASLEHDLLGLSELVTKAGETIGKHLGSAEQVLVNDLRKPYADERPADRGLWRSLAPWPYQAVEHLAIKDFERDRQKLQTAQSALRQCIAELETLNSELREGVLQLSAMICRRKRSIVADVSISADGEISDLQVVDNAA